MGAHGDTWKKTWEHKTTRGSTGKRVEAQDNTWEHKTTRGSTRQHAGAQASTRGCACLGISKHFSPLILIGKSGSIGEGLGRELRSAERGLQGGGSAERGLQGGGSAERGRRHVGVLYPFKVRLC